MPLTRRKSALEQAQQVALSFALDDDETIDSFLPDEQVAKEKEKSFALQLQRRPSPTSGETRNSCRSESSNEEMRYQWARAQALASAMNHDLDSEDDDSSIDGSTTPTAPTARKVDDIFSQMHLGGERICQGPNCQCKSTEFTVSRRTLPRTSLSRKTSADSSEKSVQSLKVSGEFTDSRRIPASNFICKERNHSEKRDGRQVLTRTTGDEKDRDRKATARSRRSDLRSMEERLQMRTSNKERRFEEQSRGQNMRSEEIITAENVVIKTPDTASESSEAGSETPPESNERRLCKPRFIYSLLGTVSVLAIAIVVVVLSRDDASIQDVPDEPTAAPSALKIPTHGTIAVVPETICMEQVPGDGWSSVCEAEASAKQGGGVGNLVAQAFLDQVENADIAFQSSSSCLGDIVKGNFTVADATRVLPFFEELWTIPVSGYTIGLVLEQVMEGIWGPSQVRDYPYAAGLRFNVNASAEAMNRVTNIEVNERFERTSWKPIEQDGIYTIVAGKTLLTGGILTRDNPYEEFEYIYKSQFPRGGTGKDSLTAFIAFGIEKGVLVDPQPEDYSTHVFIP
jgi:hypothetical protein